jgi:MoxR-like ATPase
MSESLRGVYKGDGKTHYEKALPGAFMEPEPYMAAKSLADAVNIALYLRRPLLLEGDPGCGKTRLAHAVAYELGYPLKECYIRSTSRAKDLLYSYDAVGRLYDIQEQNVASDKHDPLPRREYVTLGKLGEAIELSEHNIPSVVLIDEVDKADIDFPNDLLQVLDRMEFEIDEVKGWKFEALSGRTRQERRDFLPLFIITSNREKELPKPFLRRCLFYYIEFPDQATLTEIIRSHFPNTVSPVFQEAVKRFWELRSKEIVNLRKPPSTSELLDWVQILEQEEKDGKITAEQLMRKSLKELPYLETLVKTQSDLTAIKALSDSSM